MINAFYHNLKRYEKRTLTTSLTAKRKGSLTITSSDLREDSLTNSPPAPRECSLTNSPPTKWEGIEGRAIKALPASLCQFCPILYSPPQTGGGDWRKPPRSAREVAGKSSKLCGKGSFRNEAVKIPGLLMQCGNQKITLLVIKRQGILSQPEK